MLIVFCPDSQLCFILKNMKETNKIISGPLHLFSPCCQSAAGVHGLGGGVCVSVWAGFPLNSGLG